ncbi:MAG: hypothetical protein WCH98_00480 [Verrucomicrobiota bacterium]
MPHIRPWRSVTTVTGEIPSAGLGVTLAHEHIICEVSLHSGNPDNLMQDIPLMVEELALFRQAGGHSIIEVTPEGIGRDPVKLRAISEASGVQIVSGIAFYEESTYPAWLRTATVDAIADYFVRQIAEGTDGVRAGLIGELMSHNEPVSNCASYQLTAGEAHVFQAAAQAQRRTGVAISTHAYGGAGHAQLDMLERAGVDLERVVIGHCDVHWPGDLDADLEYVSPILERGAFCQFDLIGWDHLADDASRADRVAALAKTGFEKRILLATDTCRLSQLRRNGGRGYGHLLESFLPKLRERGVTEAQIHSMLVDAPRRLLDGGGDEP